MEYRIDGKTEVVKQSRPKATISRKLDNHEF